LKWAEIEWKTYATVLDNVAAADSVLFERDGLFWITYTDIDIDPFDNLNLCFAPSLAGPWQVHPRNPVKFDPRSSRGAGTPFSIEGQIYRPVQDCGECYGGAVRIMKITECSPSVYREEEVSFIVPGPGKNPHGFHTLSSWGAKCLVDGKRMMFSPGSILTKA